MYLCIYAIFETLKSVLLIFFRGQAEKKELRIKTIFFSRLYGDGSVPQENKS
jgi:hypothetical protein